MESLHTTLLELQQIDAEITQAEKRVATYADRFSEVEAPLRTLENEAEALRSRIADYKQQIHKLETGAQNKHERLHAYEERLDRTRTMRDESATRVEIDLVRRAAEADTAEARDVGQEMTRTELKLDELEKQIAKVRADVDPKREELQLEAQEAEDALAILRDRRANHTVRLDKSALSLYERVRGRNDRRVLAPMTTEGACGACFSVLPLQEQTEVKRGTTLHRCEACGVILYPEPTAED